MSLNKYEGWIYCLTNRGMPGLVKIGITYANIPVMRAKQLFTTGVPYPFDIAIAVRVKLPKNKEQTLHEIFNKYRCNQSREFFKIELEEALLQFKLLDGEIWDIKNYENEIKIIQNIKNEDEDEDEINNNVELIQCNEMDKIFENGTKIRHTVGIDDIWIGIYDKSINKIIYNDKEYSTLSSFTFEHHKSKNPNIVKGGRNSSGWKQCEAFFNGQWERCSDINWIPKDI